MFITTAQCLQMAPLSSALCDSTTALRSTFVDFCLYPFHTLTTRVQETTCTSWLTHQTCTSDMLSCVRLFSCNFLAPNAAELHYLV